MRQKFTKANVCLFREDFDTLGIDKNASRKDIKKAYFKKAKELHPDSNPVNARRSPNEFHDLNEAYQP